MNTTLQTTLMLSFCGGMFVHLAKDKRWMIGIVVVSPFLISCLVFLKDALHYGSIQDFIEWAPETVPVHGVYGLVAIGLGFLLSKAFRAGRE